MATLTWQRREGGYMRSDGAWFLYRGARMTHGANAWLVHRRLPADSPRIGRDGDMAYDTKDGDLLWRIDEDGYADIAQPDSDAPLYAHEFDAGWLSEAKAIVAEIETREAQS